MNTLMIYYVNKCRIWDCSFATLIDVRHAYYLAMKYFEKEKSMQRPEIQLELPNINTYKFIASKNEMQFYYHAE